jgi:DNA invertase Pin-like site-specific DNA recombinase
MVADAPSGKFDALLVLKMDRFARSLRDATVYRELLDYHGVEIKSRTEPGVGERTPAGFLMGGMSDLWSEFYSVQLSDNVARGMATRAQKGLPLGDIPFGYRSTSPNEPPVVVPDEAEAIQRAFERYAAGDQSMLDIADFLNVAGFRPRSKGGRLAFSKATVRGMLENPIYVGDITHHGKVIGQGRHAPIVSRELWERVQLVRDERARRPQVYGARARRAYLLSGVAFCSACNSPVWPNTTGGGRNCYYRCSSRSRGDDCPSARTSCRSEPPERELSKLFLRLELPPAWRRRVEELTQAGNHLADVKRERRRLEEKIARIRKGLIDGILDNEMAKAAIQEAQADLAALPKPDGGALKAGEMLTGIQELWPHMTAEERRDLVRLVLAKVEVDLRTG